jgi:hypothetical protein
LLLRLLADAALRVETEHITEQMELFFLLELYLRLIDLPS